MLISLDQSSADRDNENLDIPETVVWEIIMSTLTLSLLGYVFLIRSLKFESASFANDQNLYFRFDFDALL